MPQSAPGKYFRKGITLAELFAMFPDDGIRSTRWYSYYPAQVALARANISAFHT